MRIDRLARSVNHLLEVIETLKEERGIFPVVARFYRYHPTQGMFSLQVLTPSPNWSGVIADQIKGRPVIDAGEGQGRAHPPAEGKDPATIEGDG